MLDVEVLSLLKSAVDARGVAPVAAMLGVLPNTLASALLGRGRKGTVVMIEQAVGAHVDELEALLKGTRAERIASPMIA